MQIFLQLFINALITGAQYSLAAMSFALQYRVLRFFNLAHGVLVLSGAYTFFFLCRVLELPIFVGVIGSMLVPACLGWLMYVLVYAPLKKRKASDLVLLVASLGIMTMGQAGIIMMFGSQYKTLLPPTHEFTVHNFFGASITTMQILTIVISCVVAAALIWFLKYTFFGKKIRAISDDEETAKVMGIHTERVIARTVALSSGLAGLMGLLAALDIGIHPSGAFAWLIAILTSAIIGGLGLTSGAFVGSYFLSGAEVFGIWLLQGEWKAAIGFAVLIIFLWLRPHGLLKR